GLALAEVKVVARRTERLSREKPRDMIAQQPEIERFEQLEVVSSVRVARRPLTIDVVIIERELDRSNAVDEKLYLESLDERGLPRRRGAGYAHHAYSRARLDFVGDHRDALLVE